MGNIEYKRADRVIQAAGRMLLQMHEDGFSVAEAITVGLYLATLGFVTCSDTKEKAWKGLTLAEQSMRQMFGDLVEREGLS